jgi:hypothetical protein
MNAQDINSFLKITYLQGNKLQKKIHTINFLLINMDLKISLKNVGVIGFEPIQPKQQIYSLPRLSNFGAPPK